MRTSNLKISGSLLVVDGGITGSLLGTASYTLSASYVAGTLESASFATTASYALNGGGGTADFAFTPQTITNTSINLVATDSDIVLDADGGVYIGSAGSGNGIITAGYFDTVIGDTSRINNGTGHTITDNLDNIISGSVASASYSTYAVTASYALNGGTTDPSSSWASSSLSASYWSGSIISASHANQSDNSYTASYVVTSQTASYWSGSITSASYAVQAGTSYTASYVETAQTASYVANAITASYIQTAQTASNLAGTASWATTAVTANTASYSNIAQTASYIGASNTASYALAALTASFAVSYSYNFVTQSNALSASWASQSLSASYVVTSLTASYVATAQTASYVVTALTASFVTTARTASYVQTAQTASLVSGSNVAGTVSSSYTASQSDTITVTAFNSDVDSLVLVSNVSGRTGVGIGAGSNLKYNAFRDKLSVGSINVTTAITGSLLGTADTASYVSGSNVKGTVSSSFTASFAATAAVASFVNQLNQKLVVTGAVEATLGFTGSVLGTATTASYVVTAQTASWVSGSNVKGTVSSSYTASYVATAQTASYVNALSQSLVVSGTVLVGSIGASSTENTLAIFSPIGVGASTGEGGQVLLGAQGGTYTSASMVDVYQDSFRLLKGTNAGGSTAEVQKWDLQTLNSTLNGSLIMPNRPAFSVYGSGTTNNLSTASNTNGTLNSNNWTEEFNQGSYLTGSTGVFTAPVAGLYQTNLVARNSGYSSGISQIAIVKNNTITAGNLTMLEFAASSTMNHTGIGKVFKLAVGDTLRIKVLAGQINFDYNDGWSVVYLG